MIFSAAGLLALNNVLASRLIDVDVPYCKQNTDYTSSGEAIVSAENGLKMTIPASSSWVKSCCILNWKEDDIAVSCADGIKIFRGG